MFNVSVSGCAHPRRPAGRVLAVWKKRENLNPFVYQESAGRANSHNGYWNLGKATELPAFPPDSVYETFEEDASTTSGVNGTRAEV
jgi:hypothetical protein